jgi:hypothetical protein
VRLANGRELSAVEMQSEYLQRAMQFAKRRGLSPLEEQALAMWEHVMTHLENDPLKLSTEIDWVIKHHMIEAYREKHDLQLTNPRVALLDLAYHDVTRARSLEAFSFADARDAWLVDDGDGLAFAFVGVVPERRHAVASYYGGLTLRNGVPIGYHQADVVGRGAALSFNTFDTFRGGEAAFTFGRWLAALRP